MKIAIIDIGSNSVRLMMWADGKTLYKKICTTRLGKGIGRDAMLSVASVSATERAICDFCAEAEGAGASVYLFATAAVRTAKNGRDFCNRVERSCGYKIDVVSGEVEASLGIAGALGDSDGGIVDIGGASTEVIFQKDGKTTFAVSMPIGAVRLSDECRENRALLEKTIGENLRALDGVSPVGKLYGVGGTAATVAGLRLKTSEYSAEVFHGLAIADEFVLNTADKLLAMSVEERKAVPGMDVARADIIAGGVLLLGRILEKLCMKELIFSDADNLEGYLHKFVVKGENRE